jgi:hypothetical protein
VTLVHDNGIEPLLPQMALPIIEHVCPPGIPFVNFAEKPRKRMPAMWNHHEVHVVRHQTVGQDAQLWLLELAACDIKIGPVIPVVEESALPSDTALCHVVRKTLDHQSLKFRHSHSRRTKRLRACHDRKYPAAREWGRYIK